VGGAVSVVSAGVRLVLPPEPQGLAEPGSNEEDIRKCMSVHDLSELLKRTRTGAAVGKHVSIGVVLLLFTCLHRNMPIS
jgi:hypothetical protein